MSSNHSTNWPRVVLLAQVVLICAAALVLQTPAIAKMSKAEVKQRLRSLETVFVRGEGLVARYVKQNLEKQTCLREPEQDEGADAVLTVSQQIWPCQLALSKMCLSVTAKLTDAETDEVLWFRTDDQFGSRTSIGIDEDAGKWVLWNLNSTCCKKR